MARIIIIIIKDIYDVPDLFRNMIVVGMCNNNSPVNIINRHTHIDTPLHAFTHAHAHTHTHKHNIIFTGVRRKGKK